MTKPASESLSGSPEGPNPASAGEPNPVTLTRVKEAFLAAVDLQGDARETELNRLCAHDPQLRSKVVAMLKRDAVERGFLESPAAILAPAGQDPPTGGPSLDRLGPYKIVGLLGEGGFGTVYRAKQELPIRRDVAVKVIRWGGSQRTSDSRAVVARFEAERQTLAFLSHPNIARVFDAGETADGHPYFVMELIDGMPITRHADERRLALDARLRLFVEACRAVEHAHQKGVIHRDIKPSNVLVQSADGRVEVKVIDFGIAKAIDPTAASGTTHAGEKSVEAQLVGTPDYMSPEQVDPELGGIHTRADLYALGTLLYELLTGVTPLGIASRSSSSLPATLRLICETEPPRPSQRVAARGTEGNEAAVLRGLDPRRLQAALTGDLDHIVMRAIEKERARRYDSVGALVADIQRHLAHEPVLAARPSAAYVARKFVRRHRVGVMATALVLVSLAVGMVTTLLALSRAIGAEAKATQARDELATVNSFLVDDLLSQARPGRGGHKTTIIEAMGKATSTVDQRFATQPVLAARVRAVIASAYRSLGLFAEALSAAEPAVSALREGLGDSDPLTLDAQSTLAGVLSDMGRFVEAEEVIRSAEARARETFGLDSGVALSLRTQLGELLQTTGRHAEAEPMLIDVLERMKRVLPADDVRFLQTAASLVASLVAQDRHAEAVPYSQMVLERSKARFPRGDPMTLAAMNNHAAMLTDLGRPEEAEAAYRELLDAVTEAMPEGHWQIAVTRLSLGISIARQEGRHAEASEYLRAAALDLHTSLGPDHAFTSEPSEGGRALSSGSGARKCPRHSAGRLTFDCASPGQVSATRSSPRCVPTSPDPKCIGPRSMGPSSTRSTWP
jgi:eukaryotic-like serine/threonine-protein kinase